MSGQYFPAAFGQYPDRPNNFHPAFNPAFSEQEMSGLYLKVMINKERSKVLFAEANSDFVDVLLSFLTLPLGKIVRILDNTNYGYAYSYGYVGSPPPVGSLTTLYRSIANLGGLIESRRLGLLNPVASISEAQLSKLKINLAEPSTPAARTSKRKRNQTDDDAVFVVKSVSFLITDDLQIVPVSPTSMLQSLIKIGVTNTAGAVMQTVNFDLAKMMDVLQKCLTSEAPLTDIILNRRSMISRDLQPKMEKKPSSSCDKMSVKAMVQRSTNKVLYVVAGEDFVHFILSFLTLPLGAVACLFAGQTCGLRTVDNLYRSVACIDEGKYLKTKDTKEMLLKPKLHHYYAPQKQLLPFLQNGLSLSDSFYSEMFVEGPVTTYIVTDDLTMTPFCLMSSVDVFSKLNVPLSDVREMDMQIGDEEALVMLRASLTSNSVLTAALFSQKSKLKSPKQEC